MKSLFVLLVVLVAVSYCQSPWTGEWTDNSGLGVSQFICANNGALTFSAIYSEAGFLIGNLTSDFRSVHGNFYEAGLGDCTWGTFSFYLAPDSKSFSGSYTCGDDTTTEIPVFETRINSDTPTSDECGAFTLVAQVPDGHYTSAVNNKHVFDICTTGSSVQMSFEYPVILTTTSVLDAAIAAGVPLDPQEHGYAYGNVYESGNVMKLFSVDSAGNKYAFLVVRSGRNYNFFGYCARNEFGRAQSEDYDSPCQITSTLIRSGASTAAQSCTRNVNLKLELSSSQIVPVAQSSSSSFAIPVVSISTFSIMMVLMFVALMSF